MNVDTFSLLCYVLALILAVYVIRFRANWSSSILGLRSHAKDALDERESVIRIIGSILLALSGGIRFLMEEMNWLTPALNVISLGAMQFAILLWAWAIVRH